MHEGHHMIYKLILCILVIINENKSIKIINRIKPTQREDRKTKFNIVILCSIHTLFAILLCYVYKKGSNVPTL